MKTLPFSGPLVLLAKTAPHVPRPLPRVVETLLEKKSGDRYDEYDALVAALESAAPGPLRMPRSRRAPCRCSSTSLGGERSM